MLISRIINDISTKVTLVLLFEIKRSCHAVTEEFENSNSEVRENQLLSSKTVTEEFEKTPACLINSPIFSAKQYSFNGNRNIRTRKNE